MSLGRVVCGLVLACAFGAAGRAGAADCPTPFPFHLDETPEEKAARLGVDPQIVRGPTPWAPVTEETSPGAYTCYSTEGAQIHSRYEMDFTWDDAPASGYLFQAYQFFFQADEGGYMGPQLVGTQKKMIFSIWDLQDGSPTTSAVPGFGDRCVPFGGEGTGTRCLLNYPWVRGRTYRLRVVHSQTQPTFADWRGIVVDTVTNIETTIGAIRLRNAPGGLSGYGWLTGLSATFLEYFSGPPHCTGQPYSRLTWRGPFPDAGTVPAREAVVDYATCGIANVSSTGKPAVVHEGGGSTLRTFDKGVDAWRYSTRSAYVLFRRSDGRADLEHFETRTRARTMLATFVPDHPSDKPLQYSRLPDGTARLLWERESTFEAVVWTLDAGHARVSARVLSPPPNQRPRAYHKVPGGDGRLVWADRDEPHRASVWRLDDQDGPVAGQALPPAAPGWNVDAYVVDDGVPGLLWRRSDAAQCQSVLWRLRPDDTYSSSVVLPSRSGPCSDVSFQSRGLRHVFHVRSASNVAEASVLTPDFTSAAVLDAWPYGASRVPVDFGAAALPVATFTPGVYLTAASSVPEGAPNATTTVPVVVSLTAPTTSAVTVAFETADVTAAAGSDYEAVPATTLTIPAGTRNVTVPVTVRGDALYEGNEEFAVRLGGATGAIVLGTGERRVTIADDDPPPTLGTADVTLATEGDAGTRPLVFRLSLSQASGLEVRARFRTLSAPGTASPGVDYQPLDVPIVIPAGVRDVDVPVEVIGDRLYEPGGPETFTVELGAAVGAQIAAPGTWTGRIQDDDPRPRLLAGECARREGHGGATPCRVGVQLSNPSTQTISVIYALLPRDATPDGDYVPAAGTLTFPPEATERTVDVLLLGDLVAENNEVVLLDLRDPVNADIAGQGSATILDDEAMDFYAIAPCRIFDTRFSWPLACDGTPRRVQLADTCGSVPLVAKAVAVNVTAIPQSQPGTLRMYPAGLPRPDTSILNFVAQRAQANNATVLAGASGQATVECLTAPPGGQIHFVVDVYGFYR